MNLIKLMSNKFYRMTTRPVPEEEIRNNVIKSPSAENLLETLAVNSNLNPFTKWWHYFNFYESKLSEIARLSREGKLHTPLRILELGVWKGGSLDLWRQYFGPSAIIYGIDIVDPKLKECGGQIRIGSQVDSEFVSRVVSEMGGVDIVFDDGSHRCEHVVSSFEILYPLLSSNGLYFIEDLHTSYWPQYGGGLKRRNSSIEYFKEIIDNLNQSYFIAQPCYGKSQQVFIPRSIEFTDSMALITKGEKFAPQLFFGGRSTNSTC